MTLVEWIALVVVGLPLALCLWMVMIGGLVVFWRVYLDISRSDRREGGGHGLFR